jgi:hypothetical protein
MNNQVYKIVSFKWEQFYKAKAILQSQTTFLLKKEWKRLKFCLVFTHHNYCQNQRKLNYSNCMATGTHFKTAIEIWTVNTKKRKWFKAVAKIS